MELKSDIDMQAIYYGIVASFQNLIGLTYAAVHVPVPSSTIVCATHQVSCTLVIMVTVPLSLSTGSRGGAAGPKVVCWITFVLS